MTAFMLRWVQALCEELAPLKARAVPRGRRLFQTGQQGAVRLEATEVVFIFNPTGSLNHVAYSGFRSGKETPCSPSPQPELVSTSSEPTGLVQNGVRTP